MTTPLFPPPPPPLFSNHYHPLSDLLLLFLSFFLLTDPLAIDDENEPRRATSEITLAALSSEKFTARKLPSRRHQRMDGRRTRTTTRKIGTQRKRVGCSCVCFFFHKELEKKILRGKNTQHAYFSMDLGSLILRFQQDMPVTYLFTFAVSHLIPMRQLFFSAAVESQREPTDHLFSFDTSLIVHGNRQSHFWQLEERHLKIISERK